MVIEPYDFQKKTNIEEHNDIVNKLNEIVDVINATNLDIINDEITDIKTDISNIDSILGIIPDNYATKADVIAKDISAVTLNKTNSGFDIILTRPAGDLSDSITLPLIKTATLIPTTTARAFQIQFTFYDDTVYTTNDFVIPEGGGTDVSVTGITIENGSAPNSFVAKIQLSDGSSISSNDYVVNIDTSEFVTDAYFTEVLSNYETMEQAEAKYQPKGNYLTEIPIGGSAIGGVKNGGNVIIASDGTMSVSALSTCKMEIFTVETGLPYDFEEHDVILARVSKFPYFSNSEFNDSSSYTPVVIFTLDNNVDVLAPTIFEGYSFVAQYPELNFVTYKAFPPANFNSTETDITIISYNANAIKIGTTGGFYKTQGITRETFFDYFKYMIRFKSV